MHAGAIAIPAGSSIKHARILEYRCFDALVCICKYSNDCDGHDLMLHHWSQQTTIRKLNAESCALLCNPPTMEKRV